MTELDAVRSVFEMIPAPADDVVGRARDALRREIAATAPRRRPRRLRVAIVGAVAVAALALAATLTLSGSNVSFGVRIAAAATAAVTPPRDELVHEISSTTLRFTDRVGTTTSRWRDERWWGRSPATSVEQTSYGAAGTVTTLLSPCGAISYDSAANLFTVSPVSSPFNPLEDPVTNAVNALRYGVVRYRGTLVYRGVAAAKLVVTQHGSTTTYIVRRDNGYPLETIDRRVTSYSTRTETTTYALFEHVAHTRQNDRHVALTPHPGAFVLRTARAAPTSNCRNFGSLSSLTSGIVR